MDDDANRMQARVFLAAVDAEIDAVSGELVDVRRRVDQARVHGTASSRSTHMSRAEELKDSLRELHRQAAALRARFDL